MVSALARPVAAMKPALVGRVSRVVAEKAARMLGWRAEHSLVDMCRDAWRWQQNYLRMQQS